MIINLFLGEIQLLHWPKTLNKIVKIGLDSKVAKVGDTDSGDVIAARAWRFTTRAATSTAITKVRRHVLVAWCCFGI